MLAPDGKLWYIDPLAARPNSTLGVYDPNTESQKHFVIPIEGIGTGLTVDSSGNLWVPTSQSNKVVKFIPQTEQFESYDIPTAQAEPVGIMTDSQGNVWFAEAIGKIAKIDVNSGNITEYAPKNGSKRLTSQQQYLRIRITLAHYTFQSIPPIRLLLLIHFLALSTSTSA